MAIGLAELLQAIPTQREWALLYGVYIVGVIIVALKGILKFIRVNRRHRDGILENKDG